MKSRDFSSNTAPLRNWRMSGLLGVALFLFGIGAKAQVDVTATAGTLSQSYTTLGAAFTAINAGTHQGVITIGISGNTTESATASLNSGAVAPASWTSMSIAPTGGARVITGNIVGAIVKLNGADNVTIDGRIAGSGRNLTISNSNTSGSTAAIWLASVAAGNGCTGNTIRNLEIACGATQNTSTNSTFGIIMCGTSISTTTNGVDNDNNTFQENRIIRCRYGITTRGTTTNLNESPQVLNNIVGPTAFGADEIGKVGIFMQADNNAIVRGNTVQFVGGDFANTSGGADRVGIGIGQESWSTAPSTLTSTNYTVDRNVIHDVVEERTFSAVGLLLGTTNGGSATNNVVCSNMIYNVRANGTSGDQTVGLGISGGHSDQVVYNSIRLSGDVDPNPSASATTNYGSGIRIANTNGTTHLNLTLKNNIVYMDLSSSSTSAVRYYAISGPANSYAFGTGGENNNDLYYNPSNPQCLTGGLGTSSGNTLTTQFTTLANWQGAYTVAQDANSIQVDPGFVSSTDLHINSGSTAVNNLGTPVGCTTDFDGDTRSGSTPDIGADEYAPVTCTGTPNVPTAAFTGGASTCNGSTKGMSATGATVGAGISYQWEVSTIGGGLGFSNVVGGTGATSTSYTSGSLSTGTYYFRLRTNCSFTTPPADVSYSNEILLTVYAIPTASATNNGPACAGGTVDLDGTTDIGTSYTWSGPNGFASTSEDPSVSPIVAASAGIYTFTASANGCTSTPATTTVSVNPLIYSSGATASPTTICSGSTSNLSIVAGTTSAYTVSSATFGLLSGTGTTAVTGDDAAGTAITMPFAFDYFGTAYTSVIPYSNGWIQLGTSSGSTSSYSVTIPTAGAPETIIAGLKDDLNVTGGGTCTYFTVGSSPNRVFVVYWNGVKFYNSASNNGNATFQIQLFEKDMHIEVHIADATDPVASAKTVGIEDQTGTVGYTPTGRNNVTFSVAPGTPEAWAFYPSGGTLSYSWSPSGDVVSPGSASTATNALFASTPFTVIVSDGTCSISSNVTVNVNAAITSASITGTVEYCAGGSTTLTAVPADGVPTYTYLWSPNGETTASIVVSAPGNYSCQVGDACSGSVNTGTATVIEKPVPTATAGSNSPVCTGDAINLSGATDIGTAFSWTGPGGYTSSSQNPTIGSAALTDAGTYTFTASLNGCTSLPSNTSVSVNPSPTNVTANASATTVCAGSQVDLTSSADPVNVTVLSQNFNSAPAGWTTVNNSTGGTPANTAWTLRPNAYNTGGTWGAVLSSNDASQFYLSNSDAGGSGISGTTFLISPVIDLSSYSAVSLGFWHYYRDLGTNDTARVQISTNGGASWTDVQVFTATTGLPATFANATINLNAYAGQSNVTLRFRYRFGWDYGWAVDNVTVTAAQNLSYSWVSAPVYYTSNVQNPTGVTVASVPTTFTVTASTGLCSTDANVVVNADLTDTDGDLIPDCEDSCPTLAGEIGDACNDGNPNTVLDVIDGTCTCVGQACTTDLDIIFQPDGVSDIGWELRQQGTDILVQSGNGVYPASPGYSLATCLPDGCFYLVVTDDGGDGITGGGYQLRVNSSGRLIDNLRDAFGNGGFTTGSVSQIANGEGFCLPLGQDRLIFTSCDKLDWRTGPCNAEYVYANDNALVTAEYGVSNATSGYQMWWFDPNGGYSFRRFQSHSTNNGLPVSATRACGFRLNNWSGNQLAQGVLYNVKVRGRVNGTFLPWGPACRLMLDDAAAQCPRTKLMDIPGNQFLSCGETRAVANNAYVHARPVRRMQGNCTYLNANRYQFRFRIIAENFVLVKTSATGQYFVNTMGLACGKTYEVDVRASFDNGATWCDAGGAGLNDPAWGDVCLLTTSNCFNGGGQSIALQGNGVNGALTMYPNPNRGDQLFINLSQVEEGVSTVSVDIYDGFGKRVAARTIAVQDGFVNTVLELRGELATGMYLVNITAGSTLHTERLVIQP